MYGKILSNIKDRKWKQSGAELCQAQEKQGLAKPAFRRKNQSCSSISKDMYSIKQIDIFMLFCKGCHLQIITLDESDL